MSMPAVGDRLVLSIEKPVAGGRMIARASGLVVLVSGAIPGERVEAAVERVGKGVAYATAIAILESSSDRRPDAGDLLCGGCLYAHIDYRRQLELKSAVIADALARIGKIPWAPPISVVASPERGYRMRARLHVGQGQLGFFREGTHVVCDARKTGQLLPDSFDALEALAARLDRAGFSSVEEVEIAENADASERAVHLRSTVSLASSVLAELVTTTPLTGLSSASSSVGSPYVVDRVSVGEQTITFRRHTTAFFQGNRFLLQPLVAHVVGRLEPSESVIDLYAGVGLFAAAAAARGLAVTAVEGDHIAAADLRLNAQPFGGHLRTAHASVEEFVARRVTAGALIVDPPRTGLSRAAQDGILAIGARRVVYVSCDVATLARDARRLVDHGYQVTRVDAFDLFPNTPHVETIMVFERA